MPKRIKRKKGSLAAVLKAKQKPGTDVIDIGNGLDNVHGEEEFSSATLADAASVVSGVRYLVRGWIPFGMLTGLVAEPGVGKSAFALGALLKPVVTGCDWFTGMRGPEAADVALIDTESSLAITVQRAKDWNIPTGRIRLPFEDDPLRSVSLTDSEHLERIENLICHYRTPLVLVDSLRGAHSDDENNSRVGRVLQSLAGIAERTHAAVVIVHHTRKLSVDEEITANSSRGSNAILAMFRSQLGIDHPDPNSKRCRIRVLKENLGLAPAPVGFEVTNEGLTFGPAPERPRKNSAKADAGDWLLSRMKPGKSYLASAILTEAIECGHSERTLRKAATEILGIKPKQKREGGQVKGWLWRLP